MLIAAGDVGAAIDKDSISAATAGMLHTSGDMFFVGAELAMILFFVGTAVVALRTGVLPKWWAIFAILIAIVLVIGPIGWAALIFGTPVWLLGTGLVVGADAAQAAPVGGGRNRLTRAARVGGEVFPPTGTFPFAKIVLPTEAGSAGAPIRSVAAVPSLAGWPRTRT